MFEALTEKLSGLVSKLRFKAKLTERNVADACEEVRVALLEADVNYGVAREFVKRVKDKALGQEVIRGVDPGPVGPAAGGGAHRHLRLSRVPGRDGPCQAPS